MSPAADRAELCAAAYRRLAEHMDAIQDDRWLWDPVAATAETARLRTEAAGAAERLRDALPVGHDLTAADDEARALRAPDAHVVVAARLRLWATAWDAFALATDPAAGRAA